MLSAPSSAIKMQFLKTKRNKEREESTAISVKYLQQHIKQLSQVLTYCEHVVVVLNHDSYRERFVTEISQTASNMLVAPVTEEMEV